MKYVVPVLLESVVDQPKASAIGADAGLWCGSSKNFWSVTARKKLRYAN
jgi:hypothetical protein